MFVSCLADMDFAEEYQEQEEAMDADMEAAIALAAADLEAARLPMVKPASIGAWALQRNEKMSLVALKKRYDELLDEAREAQRNAFLAIVDDATKNEYYAASKACYAAEMLVAGFQDAVREGIRPCGQVRSVKPDLQWDVVAMFNPDSDDIF